MQLTYFLVVFEVTSVEVVRLVVSQVIHVQKVKSLRWECVLHLWERVFNPWECVLHTSGLCTGLFCKISFVRIGHMFVMKFIVIGFG